MEFSSLYIINYQKWRHIQYFTRNQGSTHQTLSVVGRHWTERPVDQTVGWSLQGTTSSMGLSWRYGWFTTRSWLMEKIKIIKSHERHLVLKNMLIWNNSSSDIIFYLKKRDHFIQIKFQLALSNVQKGIFWIKIIRISLKVKYLTVGYIDVGDG